MFELWVEFLFQISIPAVGLPVSEELLLISKVPLSMNFSRIQLVSQTGSFNKSEIFCMWWLEFVVCDALQRPVWVRTTCSVRQRHRDTGSCSAVFQIWLYICSTTLYYCAKVWRPVCRDILVLFTGCRHWKLEQDFSVFILEQNSVGGLFCVVVCCFGFFFPQMSNNFLSWQVVAADFVALWSTSEKTVQKNRMQVRCRGEYRVEFACTVV